MPPSIRSSCHARNSHGPVGRICNPSKPWVEQSLKEGRMSTTSSMFVLLSATTAFAPLPVQGDEGAPAINHLKSEVQKAEEVVAKAQCDLARARARLAHAEGRTDI